MAVRTIATPYGARALSALRDVVRAAKASDPMAAVTLLVPNNVAGIVARRELSRGLSDVGNGVAGLHLATLPRLAEQLASGRLAPRRPAGTSVVAAAWRSALAGNPSVFDSVSAHPATIRALVTAHRELRDLSAAGLDAVAAQSRLTNDLVRLHRAVTASLLAGWYDATDLLDAATERIDAAESIDGAFAADLGALVLYLPQELTLAESRFTAALAAHGDLTMVVGMTDVNRADRTVRRSLDRVGHPLDAEKGKPRVAHEVFHASDSDDEVRCIVRDVVRTLQVAPAHRVAVLYGAGQPYARLLHEHLTAAGIAVNGAGTRAVIERAIGRGFVDILLLAQADLPESDLPRADLFRAVSEAPTRTFDGDRVPSSRWERLSRSAAIVSGDDWVTRLEASASALESALIVERARDDPFQSRIDAHERDLVSVRGLQAFTVTLRERLHDGLSLTSWPELSAWASALFSELYGDAAALAQLPGEEQYAAVTVASTLSGLADLDAFEATASLRGLIEALTLALESALPRVGHFGEGVFVAPLSASVGLAADVVYVVGLAEDSYPGRLGEDALLLERVRDASGGELASYRDRLDARHRQLLAAFDAAPRVVAAFPRGDLRRSTQRLPSRLLLPTLRKLADDRTLRATAWESVRAEGLTGSASYAASLASVALPASEQEWQTQASLLGQALADPVVDSALQMLRSRARDDFTRYDGNLTGATGLPDYADGKRLVSPTALEAYAICPHAFFVQRLLRVEPVEQPEEIVSISSLDIGNLVHETMDVFITECGDTLPGHGDPWTTAHHTRLTAIASNKAVEFERRGATGHQALWESERDRVLADLDYMLDDDSARRAVRGSRVVRSELAFGKDGADPVAVAVEGGTVLMRGSADKVDEARDGTLVVVDIKTGSLTRFKPITMDPIVAGTKLQLPVYAEAARQLLGGQTAEAAYWFVRQGKRGWIEVDLTDELRAAYSVAIGTLVSSIATGLFPAKAPDVPDFAWVQCPYCNPDGLGHGEVRTRWERKRHDPGLQRLVSLVDPAAVR